MRILDAEQLRHKISSPETLEGWLQASKVSPSNWSAAGWRGQLAATVGRCWFYGRLDLGNCIIVSRDAALLPAYH
jgi:hypothetical protein